MASMTALTIFPAVVVACCVDCVLFQCVYECVCVLLGVAVVVSSFMLRFL